MNTTEALALWKARVEEAKNSGQTIKSWCKENNISKQQYYYWNGKINKKKGKKEQATPVFAKILTDQTTTDQALETLPELVISWEMFSIKVRNKQEISLAVDLLKKLGETC